MKDSNRIKSIPKYMFSDLDRLRSKMSKEGREVIDISVGDPDLPTPEFIVKSLQKASEVKEYHRYPPYEGTYGFRKSVADYYKRRFDVELDPDGEVAALIGSKEGITHLTIALVDEGDIALVPDPAYPTYRNSVYIAGGTPYIMPLKEENNFTPDLSSIDSITAQKSKLMYINYPNNPTGSVCGIESFKDIVEFARKNDIIVCNDAAYNEIVFDNNKPVSILSVDGSKEVAVEIGTLSKSYNMTGWRIGYIVGNREIIKRLMAIKTNTDSGQFSAIQHAASVALDYGDDYIAYIKEIYKSRRDEAVTKLRDIGMSVISPKGSFYLWFKVPNGYSSSEFAAKLIEECGIIVTPGNAFGGYGEGYCRIALTIDEMQFEKAVEKIRRSIMV